MAESKSGQNRSDPAAEEAKATTASSVSSAAATEATTDERGLTPEEARQLGDLQAKVAKADSEREAAGEVMTLKVEAPHSHMVYGGVKITSEGTQVPVSMYGPLASAAADAGVTLTHVPTEE